jgi:hypothetical protein
VDDHVAQDPFVQAQEAFQFGDLGRKEPEVDDDIDAVRPFFDS